LKGADLVIYVLEQVFHTSSDVPLDLRSLVIDGAEDSETRESNQRQRGDEGQHREPRLNPNALAEE